MKKGIILMAVIFAILLVLGTFSSIKLPMGDPAGSSDPSLTGKLITLYPNEILF